MGTGNSLWSFSRSFSENRSSSYFPRSFLFWMSKSFLRYWLSNFLKKCSFFLSIWASARCMYLGIFFPASWRHRVVISEKSNESFKWNEGFCFSWFAQLQKKSKKPVWAIPHIRCYEKACNKIEAWIRITTYPMDEPQLLPFVGDWFGYADRCRIDGLSKCARAICRGGSPSLLAYPSLIDPRAILSIEIRNTTVAYSQYWLLIASKQPESSSYFSQIYSFASYETCPFLIFLTTSFHGLANFFSRFFFQFGFGHFKKNWFQSFIIIPFSFLRPYYFHFNNPRFLDVVSK